MAYVLAFDFGMKRIGVALGNTLLQSAKPLENLNAQDGKPNWDHIAKLIKDWHIEAMIVGLPTDIHGKQQFTTKAATKFANRLKAFYKLPVHLVDERYTTIEARQQVFDEGGYKSLQRTSIDSYAAKIILEQWFISQGKSS